MNGNLQLQHFILNEQKKFPYAKGDFTLLLLDIALAGKIISREVNKAGLVEILGLTGKENIQGEQVQKLDEFSNSTIVNILSRNDTVGGCASEEMADPVYFHKHTNAKYCVIFDPLDGSSNIDVNVSIGTIFSIYKLLNDGECTENDFLRKGKEQLASGYIVYGSSTMLVLTTGEGVHGFTLDPSLGEFLLSHPNMKFPEPSKRYYSVNEGNYKYWDKGVQRYVDHLKNDEKPFTLRYIGSLVSDFHRNLIYGGIFFYPLDHKNKEKPKGKLRLMYEANPLSLITKNAGGLSTDGKNEILDIKPEELHQRVPLYIGTKSFVEEAMSFINSEEK
ncbi:MAG: class 1 fructose-bisphosphatase [bacterium]|uniref:Fructose-1,6-bisphosphatase class 1 n=2 Tax=Bacteria candidate phyla TaxID=1783234 RepID=A0A117M6D5_UNCT6|nr:MAG: Fructose-1,6-bisphosphatase class 1 [candidate division TA06 bacterium 32_111]KUK86842.1 MAG: Fructose-1,6-bisphosphatase class 1 [candidate division TA06 bacterium 34_109]MDI6700769.1 class 1 fructose-bisphosphatase [bacterium]HAF07319.1 class 1 fructose-bisphosphatase [candidate division WOR-3 bacterium]HCP16447.1 class 1 fructose-bisphosphatase [candidate division WOR-3 bacterium]